MIRRRNDEGYKVAPPEGYGWMSGRTLDEIDSVRKKLGKNIVEIAAGIKAGQLDPASFLPPRKIETVKKTVKMDDEMLLKSLGIDDPADDGMSSVDPEFLPSISMVRRRQKSGMLS